LKILVIKLGALGDFVLALPALRRIREAHPEAEITLLTTAPYARLAEACPWVDRVEADGRPKGLRATTRLLRRLRRARYDRVYDLQTSSRSSAYFHFLRPDPPTWSGIARGAALPHRNPDRDRMHTLERQAEQLKDAGIWPEAPTEPGTAPAPDVAFLVHRETLAALGLEPGGYALLVPGGSAHRPEKRWPAGRYAQLALELARAGLRPVILGGPDEAALAREIGDKAPQALNLIGRTAYPDLATLGAAAALAVGNDTGPLHLIAAAGAPTLALFSEASDPVPDRPARLEGPHPAPSDPRRSACAGGAEGLRRLAVTVENCSAVSHICGAQVEACAPARAPIRH
jgi:ADP-heptose:LPS heptosyltransferase